ncbi:hypothetical protein BV898_09466 [Hypsibius exemplaris]|uniref:DUF4442 domain-containing protein n=1 Tax=Hypsibius exemplaris TaxID=2072580 RepID=A0A1W0WMN5_HYPEX|nr:hypothetical protein BV898_09466 [Hypsibius exemplaris]
MSPLIYVTLIVGVLVLAVISLFCYNLGRMAQLVFKHRTLVFKLISWWPPYRAAGISLSRVSEDLREMDVQMKMHWWNKNVFGTHFGGSIYSMTDPWYVFMLQRNLGRGYMVWNKTSTVRFRNPGKGTIAAKLKLTEKQLAEVRADLDRSGRSEPVFNVQVFDTFGKLIAEVHQIISVKVKGNDKPAQRQITDDSKENVPNSSPVLAKDNN